MQDALQNYVRYGRIFLDSVTLPEREIHYEINFRFANEYFDSVAESETTAFEKAAISALEKAETAKDMRKVLETFYTRIYQGTPIKIQIPNVGQLTLICSKTLKGEMGKCLSATVGAFGIEAGRLLARRLLVALGSLQDISAKGVSTMFVPSDHRSDTKNTFARVFRTNVGKDYVRFSVIFTVKRNVLGNALPYHLNPEGSSTYQRAYTQYLISLKQTGNEIVFSGHIKTPS